MSETNDNNDNAEALAKAQAEVSALRTEAAKYRTERNHALKSNAALTTVLDKHGVKFDVATADLSGFDIKDGKAEGAFDYTPPALTKATPAQAQVRQDNENGLSHDKLKAMTPDEINKRWDEISSFLSTQPGGSK